MKTLASLFALVAFAAPSFAEADSADLPQPGSEPTLPAPTEPAPTEPAPTKPAPTEPTAPSPPPPPPPPPAPPRPSMTPATTTKTTIEYVVRAAPAPAPAATVNVGYPAPAMMMPHTRPHSTFAFQFGAGYFNGGTVFVDGEELAVSEGAIGSVAIDAIVSPHLSLGLFSVAARTEVEGTSINVGTVGATIKARWGSSTGTQLRLGLAFGYQRISEDGNDGEDAADQAIHGLDIAPIIEVAFPSSGALQFVLQASALSQPIGGNREVDVTFKPIGYVAAMLEIRN